MEWILRRVVYQPTRTLGNLYLNGEFFCYTLEDKVRPDGIKIWGETAIPAGRYSIAITYSNRFKRPMIQILNVPMFSGIRIHPGVSEKNTHGCVLVSHNRQGNVLQLERTACTQLEQVLMRRQFTGKATLLIVDDERQVPVVLPAPNNLPAGSPVLQATTPPTWAQIESPSYPIQSSEPNPHLPSPAPPRQSSLIAEIRLGVAAVAAWAGGIEKRYILYGALLAIVAISAFYLLKNHKEKTNAR